jgi:hypothetical protein
MKKICFVLWCLMVCQLVTMGQTKRYLYIHNANNQQFNLRIDHQIYASDDTGNLIIPQLTEGALQFSVILHQQPKYIPTFQLSLDEKNQGWNLLLSKESAILENWNTKEQIIPVTQYETDKWWNGTKKTDNRFAQMMSDLVADSAVLYTTNKIVASAKPTDIAKTDPRLSPSSAAVVETAEAAVIKDTAAIGESELAIVEVVQPDTLVAEQIAVAEEKPKVDTGVQQTILPVTTKDTGTILKTAVQLKDDSTTAAGRRMTFAVREGEMEEQVDVFIPVENPVTVKDTVSQTTVTVKTTPAELAEVIDSGSAKVNTVAKPAETGAVKEQFIMYNSDCKEVATDAEIDKYRVRLLSLNQEQRFAQVQKYLKAKCFTVKQVKALSELYPSDDDKYRFFELAYPYVEETTTFKELIEFLNSELNRTKFRQMTRMQ